MFYRRRLPHLIPELADKSFLFITWRLAGSMPRVSQNFKPRSGLAGGSACPTFLASDRELDKAAFGPTWLRDPRVARVVAEGITYGEEGRQFYVLRAWAIMPNHVHVILKPKQPLSVITRWLKGSTARQANLVLGRTGQPFWQDESFDHLVRDDAELGWLTEYVEHNPVRAGLVKTPGEWLWSSAGWQAEAPAPL